jgi:hypothetical protein
LKRTVSALFVFILLGSGMVSCGGSGAAPTTSGLTYRAFISNPFNPTLAGTVFPGLNIIDVTQDVLSTSNVNLSGTVTSPGMMVETPKRDRTVVFSPATGSSTNNVIGLVDNAKESPSGSVNLPGPTESMFVASDNHTLYAAIPTAAENGLPAGAVVQIDISASTPAITTTVPIAGAHFLTPSPNGNQILVVSDTADSVSVFAPASISQGNAVTTISGFDKPVWAIFSADATTAYVMNCGPECGGTASSVSVLDMTQSPPVILSTVPVAAATMGLLTGNTLYVAGTPLASGVDCQANLCGVLTAISTANLSSTGTFAITDGYHDGMVMGPNNQLFMGSRTCTNVIASSSMSGRGCLSVLNVADGFVYTAAQNGDVTGILPIEGRTVVYVCEGGGLEIYDTNYDLGTHRQLQLQTTQITITGQAIDAKLADFPNGSLITK